jgi:hypothetical protein
MKTRRHGPSAFRAHGAGQAVEERRRHISQEAARIMAEEGVRDYQLAKRRAVERLDLPQERHLPSNEEVEGALREYLVLFQGPRLRQDTRRLRTVALDAMRFFEQLEPRLVGAVLSGTVTRFTEVQLHVTADSVEEIGWLLDEHRIPYELDERKLRFGGDRYETVPVFRFTADDVPIELDVFSREHVREAPLSPVDGRPMRRANVREVEALLSQD